MNQTNFVRSVSSWGYWICAIGKVLTAISAVLCLLGVVVLLSLPKDFVRIEVLSEVKVDLNFRDLLGENWDAAKEEILQSFSDSAALTENGVAITEKAESLALEMRAAALYLIPSFVQLSLLAAALHFGAKVFRELKDSPVPFTPEGAVQLRNTGNLVMALGAVPGITSWLIGLLTTSAMDSTSLDFSLIFTGFLLWALAEIFRYGFSLQCGVREEENPSSFDKNAF